ncbi:hypothetical protein NTGM5_330052 [Candidatus Nitrotoga sp. M5]|nr:hypothetical protein NTGM5_330052 [Candidatus Nitrotoga sp. M5]
MGIYKSRFEIIGTFTEHYNQAGMRLHFHLSHSDGLKTPGKIKGASKISIF